jgi:hypothetical protein
MSVDTGGRRLGGVTDRLRAVVRGTDDHRIRATWRVLLAIPVFWILAGGVFAGNLQSAVDAVPSQNDRLGGLAFSLLHGGFVVVALVAWARYLAHRPLSNYWVSLSRPWAADLLLGIGAVVAAFGLWFGVASALGWASVGVAMSAPGGSLLVGLGLFVVTLGIHVWIQQLVFFRLVIGNAAEGLHCRGFPAARAVIVGLVVALPIFVGVHQLRIDLRMLDLAVVGLIYGLLYVHTGELAFGIGLHLGVFVSGQALFVSAPDAAESLSVFQVTESLPESLDVLGAYGFPKMAMAYVLVLAYLVWRRGEVPVETGIARWSDR